MNYKKKIKNKKNKKRGASLFFYMSRFFSHSFKKKLKTFISNEIILLKQTKPTQQAKQQSNMSSVSKTPAKNAKVAPKPENNKYFVTFHYKTNQMDADFLGDYNVEFVETVEQITNTDIVPLCASNLSDYAKFVGKNADDIDDIEFDSVWYCYKQYEEPIQMSYTFIFHGEEYLVKFHQI